MSKPKLTPDADFDRFWAAYPRREAKLDALKAWHQLRPTAEVVDQMVATLKWQCESYAWQKAGGQFVPLPASWIRAGRWMDEPPVAQQRLVSDRTARNIENAKVAAELIRRKHGRPR